MATGDVSDVELLTRFRAGEEHALEAILERYEAPLFQFLLGMLRDHHQAEDALQEAFVRALERLDGVDGAHLRGWLFTVAYHQAMLLKRRQRSQLPGGSGLVETIRDPTPDPLELAQAREDARLLRELLQRLPAPQQEVIRQRIYEGKRFREIAADLNCPLNTALARMHEGLKRLRLLWKHHHE